MEENTRKYGDYRKREIREGIYRKRVSVMLGVTCENSFLKPQYP